MDTITATTHCEGCDSAQPDVSEYEARFVGGPGWERVRYCGECAELAAANWNGETLEVRRAAG